MDDLDVSKGDIIMDAVELDPNMFNFRVGNLVFC